MKNSFQIPKFSGPLKSNRILLCIIMLLIFRETYSQSEVSIKMIDLQNQNLKASNREISYKTSGVKKYINLSFDKEVGLLWLPVEDFKNGTVRIVMRGRNEFQRSFIGIAFHGLNDSVYEAVYCRPFNFLSVDSVRRIRSIQYISHPLFTWQKLREEQSSVFEKEVINPPDPDDWFSMTLVIRDKIIKAYINDNEIPSLTVGKLNDISSGKIGVFVADNSGGDFESIDIIYDK